MSLNDDLAQQILAMIDERPMCPTAICKVLRIGNHRAHLLMDALKMRGQAVCKPVGPHRYWHNPRLWRQLYGTNAAVKEMPVVNLPARDEWHLPAATVTYKDGVKITRQPAPRPRFAVDLPPEGGQISADWRLRRGIAGLAGARPMPQAPNADLSGRTRSA